TRVASAVPPTRRSLSPRPDSGVGSRACTDRTDRGDRLLEGERGRTNLRVAIVTALSCPKADSGTGSRAEDIRRLTGRFAHEHRARPAHEGEPDARLRTAPRITPLAAALPDDDRDRGGRRPRSRVADAVLPAHHRRRDIGLVEPRAQRRSEPGVVAVRGTGRLAVDQPLAVRHPDGRPRADRPMEDDRLGRYRKRLPVDRA